MCDTKNKINCKRNTQNTSFHLFSYCETRVSAYRPVSVAEAASWVGIADHYVSAEPWAFDPVVDLGDAYGGMKGTWGNLAHHSYPQALLVAAAY